MGFAKKKGAGESVSQIDESGGGVGDLTVGDINRAMDAWLAKREGREVSTWTKRYYGNRGNNKKKT